MSEKILQSDWEKYDLVSPMFHALYTEVKELSKNILMIFLMNIRINLWNCWKDFQIIRVRTFILSKKFFDILSEDNYE